MLSAELRLSEFFVRHYSVDSMLTVPRAESVAVLLCSNVGHCDSKYIVSVFDN